MPDMRWMKFSPIRSAVSTPRAGPDTVASTAPSSNESPSATSSSTSMAGSVRRNAAANTSPPLKTPGSRAIRSAWAVADAGMSISLVRSPQGASSSSAAPTTRSIVVLVSISEHRWRPRRRPRHPHRSIARHPDRRGGSARRPTRGGAGRPRRAARRPRAGSRPRTRLRCAAVRWWARHEAMTDAACSSPAASRTSPASSHMSSCSAPRLNAGSSFRPPSSSTRRDPSARAAPDRPADTAGHSPDAASAAIASPARAPKTAPSRSEFDASRFAPCTPVRATSPTA